MNENAGFELRIVRKPEEQRWFEVLPDHWVERTFGWLMRRRRLGRDHDRLTEVSEAMVKSDSIHLLTRRFGNRQPESEFCVRNAA